MEELGLSPSAPMEEHDIPEPLPDNPLPMPLLPHVEPLGDGLILRDGRLPPARAMHYVRLESERFVLFLLSNFTCKLIWVLQDTETQKDPRPSNHHGCHHHSPRALSLLLPRICSTLHAPEVVSQRGAVLVAALSAFCGGPRVMHRRRRWANHLLGRHVTAHKAVARRSIEDERARQDMHARASSRGSAGERGRAERRGV